MIYDDPTLRLDENKGDTGAAIGIRDETGATDSNRLQMCANLLAMLILSHFADKRHIGPSPTGSDSLIRSLSSKGREKVPAKDRFPRLGNSIHLDGKVHIG